MKFLMLYVICFGLQLYAGTAVNITNGKFEKTDRKFLIKLKRIGEYTKINLMIMLDVRGPEYTKVRNKNIAREAIKRPKLKPYYYTHLRGKIDGRVVYDIYLSEFFSSNPLYSFTYKFKKIPKKIEFIATDNEGKRFSFVRSVIPKKYINKNSVDKEKIKKEYKKDRFINFRSLKNIWKARTPEEAIKELFGSNPIIHNVKDENSSKILTLKLPELPENIVTVPLSIKSNIDLEYLFIFTDGAPRSTIAAMNIPQGISASFGTRIKLMSINYFKSYRAIYNNKRRKGKVVVIGKARDGKLYKVEKKTRHAVCINAGG